MNYQYRGLSDLLKLKAEAIMQTENSVFTVFFYNIFKQSAKRILTSEFAKV